jgi:D-alanyl-D-alanine carboxypeptidase/D-alanyl-D-alanine-endopeptidase (penicillin-binding protein 4)
MLFGCVLMDRLVRAGIKLGGKIAVSADAAGPGREDGLRVIATETTPLPVVLRRANKHSHNLMAECLFLRSAVEPGAPATWEKAAKTAAAVLQADYGLPAGQFHVADGSGFSRKNRVSPAALTSLLRAMAGKKAFVESLSIAGVDGTLQRRLAAPPCRGRILGKTGSLAGVSALSGYVLDRTGKPALAFSILINGRTRGKRRDAGGLQAAVCGILIRAVDAPAK